MSVFSAYAASKQAEANYNAQESAYNYQARIAEKQAQNIEEETQKADQRKHEEAEAFKAAQRAALGKSGAAITAGSPLAILAETAGKQEIESLDLRRQGASQAFDLRTQGALYKFQANVARSNAKSTASNRGLTIIGSTLNDAGTLISLGTAAYGAGKGVYEYGKSQDWWGK